VIELVSQARVPQTFAATGDSLLLLRCLATDSTDDVGFSVEVGPPAFTFAMPCPARRGRWCFFERGIDWSTHPQGTLEQLKLSVAADASPKAKLGFQLDELEVVLLRRR
jgi:hypothetical protein